MPYMYTYSLKLIPTDVYTVINCLVYALIKIIIIINAQDVAS